MKTLLRFTITLALLMLIGFSIQSQNYVSTEPLDKNAILEETPWVMQAKNETERKKRIALLFDLNNMNNELSLALNKLEQKQMSNGGWPWFSGGVPGEFGEGIVPTVWPVSRCVPVWYRSSPRQC